MESNKPQRLATAEEFLRQLQHTIPEAERVMVGYAEEATVQTDASGKKVNAGWWPVPWKDGKYVNSRANCYACISSSVKTPNPRTGEMRYWRGETSFGHGLALMVDDIGDGKGSKGGLGLDFFELRLPPTATVETSPGNYQLWYFFDEPVDSLLHFKALLNCFVANVLKKGGDNTIKDISRFGRMPIGYNNKREGPDGKLKYAMEDGKPFQVRLVHADYSRRYSPEEIARQFGFSIVLPQKPALAINEDDWKFDQVWLKYAERICSKLQMGEGSGGEVSMNMSGKYRIRCPWGDEHTNGDPFGAYFRGPIPGAEHEYVFGCGHDTCRKLHKRTWAVFIDEIVIPYMADALESINRKAAGI
jgi:hypothetical protein